jgi:hypothetical protein
MDKWKTQPIGGEIPPEAWGIVFDTEPGNAQVFSCLIDAWMRSMRAGLDARRLATSICKRVAGSRRAGLADADERYDYFGGVIRAKRTACSLIGSNLDFLTTLHA